MRGMSTVRSCWGSLLFFTPSKMTHSALCSAGSSRYAAYTLFAMRAQHFETPDVGRGQHPPQHCFETHFAKCRGLVVLQHGMSLLLRHGSALPSQLSSHDIKRNNVGSGMSIFK
jgi:hypothetical protein